MHICHKLSVIYEFICVCDYEHRNVNQYFNILNTDSRFKLVRIMLINTRHIQYIVVLQEYYCMGKSLIVLLEDHLFSK